MMGPIRSMMDDLYARLTGEVHGRHSDLYGTRATVSHSIGLHFMVIDVPELFGEEPPDTKGMNAAVRASGGFKHVD